MPQNSSTESNEMTSFSSSAQLSPLPLGGLVNHSVHVFISGCLTLKFSGSWKTVRISPSPPELVVEDCSWPSPEFSVGERAFAFIGSVIVQFTSIFSAAEFNIRYISFCPLALSSSRFTSPDTTSSGNTAQSINVSNAGNSVDKI